MKQGYIIPVYRHGKTACSLAERLAATGLPVILVDDGNEAETRALLAECAAKTRGVVLARLEKNSGKGGAVTRGIQTAAELGLTHALQIDADGQHDIGKAAFFLEESARYPDRIICGYPKFDENAPNVRITARRISNFWAAVVTLSAEMTDVLCGFRVYPVDAALRVTRHPFIDKRMGFDPEIMVRLYWNEVYPVFHPIEVSYPQDGISNFHIVKDNISISWTFTRLCIGMLFRFPVLIIRKIKRAGKK
jgi:glycosyltransferase involved in cell wall biosynthesis